MYLSPCSLVETNKAKVSARKARQKRKWCAVLIGELFPLSNVLQCVYFLTLRPFATWGHIQSSFSLSLLPLSSLLCAHRATAAAATKTTMLKGSFSPFIAQPERALTGMRYCDLLQTFTLRRHRLLVAGSHRARFHGLFENLGRAARLGGTVPFYPSLYTLRCSSWRIKNTINLTKRGTSSTD